MDQFAKSYNNNEKDVGLAADWLIPHNRSFIIERILQNSGGSHV
jgi:hypothetical protein